jgi:anti-sigma regulatory factor (Ser/Thr protein kinase)
MMPYISQLILPIELWKEREGRKLSEATCHAELRLPSNLIYLRPVRAFVKELAENIGFGHEKVNDIELAVDEVLSNAIEHGSVGLKSWIVVRCMSTDNMIKIIVSDAGHGSESRPSWIDAWSEAIKIEKDRPDTERGHGLLVAHSLTDEMSIESNSMGGVDAHLVVYKEK